MASIVDMTRLPDTGEKGNSYNVGGSEAYFVYMDNTPVKRASRTQRYGVDVKNRWFTDWRNEGFVALANQAKAEVAQQHNFNVRESNYIKDYNLNRFLQVHDTISITDRSDIGWMSDNLEGKKGWMNVLRKIECEARLPIFTSANISMRRDRLKVTEKNLSTFADSYSGTALLHWLSNQIEFHFIYDDMNGQTKTIRGSGGSPSIFGGGITLYEMREDAGHSIYSINLYGNLVLNEFPKFFGGGTDDACGELNIYGTLTITNSRGVSVVQTQRGSSVVNVMDGGKLIIPSNASLGKYGKYAIFGNGQIIRR